MAWLRIDDGEVLDDRVGDLTDREYRARHALLQYVAREANEDGIFDEKRANRAGFSTLKGLRTVTPTILRRLIHLGLVDRVEDLTDEYLEALGITRPHGPGWLRPSRWERFNPPKDSTNAERQRRYREALRNGVTHDVTDRRHNGPSRAGVPSRPVPKDENHSAVPTSNVGADEQQTSESQEEEPDTDELIAAVNASYREMRP